MTRKTLAAIGVVLLLLLGAAVAAADELEQVRQAIRDKGLNWTAAAPLFTAEEFRARVAPGLSLPALAPLYSPPPPLVGAVPASWDWRDQDAVTAVRDEGGCGATWAFATVGCLESAAIRQGHYPQ